MKMMIKPVIRKDRISKTNTVPVILRLTHNRKSKCVNLGFSVNVENWDDEKQCLINNYEDS
jgi:hypothetical protein